MLHIVKHRGREVVVDAIEDYIERGDYYLALHKKGAKIELCDSTYISDHISSHPEFYHKIIKADRNIHSGHGMYNDNIKIVPSIGKVIQRDNKIDKILAK